MRLIIIGEHGEEVGEASRIAAGRGADVRHVATLDAALASLRGGQSADVMLIEVGRDIAGAIRALAAEHIHLPVIAFGIDSRPREAVDAIRAGAREFLPLPPDPELISAILEAVCETRDELIFEDPAMGQVMALARQFAPADASVLITGESGTGKEVMARFIHQNSRRARCRFISVNCAAIPENLLESELFGHEKGAFTGASARRIGKFEEAHGGTLLLDEITEMDVRLQAKLLRVIQEREIDRVGGSRPVKVDIRLIATSNRDLDEAVAEGVFREDLLYRLNVLNLHLPPLRARPRDIVTLARHFVVKHSATNGLPQRELSTAAIGRLLGNSWKGNVRELENCIHRAVLLAQGAEIDADAIILSGQPRPDAESSSREGALVGRTVADVERGLILETLDHTMGNRTHAATILGISIRTLRNKLKQYGAEGMSIPPAPNEVATPFVAGSSRH
ncbi:MAG: sigma-54-dependent Fis family transcriptional regulator [Geminicoccaceae bacterium]|nr:sigma-54-dependent Fis family transcriptional regulator [Geminicoccaceae bacterium]